MPSKSHGFIVVLPRFWCISRLTALYKFVTTITIIWLVCPVSGNNDFFTQEDTRCLTAKQMTTVAQSQHLGSNDFISTCEIFLEAPYKSRHIQYCFDIQLQSPFLPVNENVCVRACVRACGKL